MSIVKESEEFVEEHYKQEKWYCIEKHGKGFDLKMRNEIGKEIFVEVKSSSKENFNDFRPYIQLSQLIKANEKGENYKIHILLGFKNKKPKKHYIISGQQLREMLGFEQFINLAKIFYRNLSDCDIFKDIFYPEVKVYLKRNIGVKVI